MGGRGHPPATCVRAFSRESLIPARDRAGTHPAGLDLRRSCRDHLPLPAPPARLDFLKRKPYNESQCLEKRGDQGMEPIYFDHAATTRVLPEAAQAASVP